jgi:hypothetical protein
MVALPNDSGYTELYPPLSYYEPNTRIFSRDIAQRAMELVGTGRVTRKSIKIPLEYAAGATIGPVPRARGQGRARRLCFISRQVERGFLPGNA